MPTRQEFQDEKRPKGGWTRAQLATWGVSWPPPKGWRKKLIKEFEGRAICHSGIVITLPAKPCGCWDRICSDCKRHLSARYCSNHEAPELKLYY